MEAWLGVVGVTVQLESAAETAVDLTWLVSGIGLAGVFVLAVLLTVRRSGRNPGESSAARVIDLATVVVAIGFTGLLLAYVYLWLRNPPWPPPDLAEPKLGGASVATAFVLYSWAAMYSASKLDPDSSMVYRPLTGAVGGGGIAIFLQWRDLRWLDRGSIVHAYGSIFSMMGGYVIGVIGVAVTMAVVAYGWQSRRFFTVERHLAMAHVVRFWTAAVTIWLMGLTILYLGPRVL